MGKRRMIPLRSRAATAIAQGDYPLAKEYLEALRNDVPADPDVLNNLAVIYEKLGMGLELQIQTLETAHAAQDTHREVRTNLARACHQRAAIRLRDQHYASAICDLERSLALGPATAQMYTDLGHCHLRLGKLELAVANFTRAANMDPKRIGPYTGLGLAFMEMRMLAEAKGAFQQVLALDPNSVSALIHLGLLANLTGLTAVAVNMFRRALDLSPNSAEAHNNLGLVLREQGEIRRGYEHYKKALELLPHNPDVFSGYLLTLNYLSDISQEEVAREHRRANEVFPSQAIPLVQPSLEEGRKLRIGYLSPDFRVHSVAFFIVGVLEAHDRDSYEITCYYTGKNSDAMTARVQKTADRFRSCYRWPDENLAAQIQADGIDVLIELSGHTCDHRLAMLRNRVAPLQLTYLGYPNTTGLSTIDWRITDAIADPAPISEPFYSERLARVPGGFLAYSPPESAFNLAVAPLPASLNPAFTFGSFNNLAKVNDEVLAIWAEILKRVPDAILIMKARGMRDERVQARLRHAFQKHGVDEGRVILKGHEFSLEEHLACYHQIDLALDTFPYSGTTTTCEALWMGVPVLTQRGDRHAGRVGASILSRVGLDAFIAQDPTEYIERAVQVAMDRNTLANLRGELRARMQGSPLMDTRRLAKEIEVVVREAWQKYCAQSKTQEAQGT